MNQNTVKNNGGVKKLVLEFENKEDFEIMFTFIWESLNKQAVKTKGKVNISSED